MAMDTSSNGSVTTNAVGGILSVCSHKYRHPWCHLWFKELGLEFIIVINSNLYGSCKKCCTMERKMGEAYGEAVDVFHGVANGIMCSIRPVPWQG